MVAGGARPFGTKREDNADGANPFSLFSILRFFTLSLSPAPVPDNTPPASWVRRRVLQPLLAILKQGLSPNQVALTIALGVCFGIVPFLGATTLLVTFAAVRLRLNVPAMLLVSHLMSPLQFLLIIPLLKTGARLLGNGADASALTLEKLRYLAGHDWRAALQILWRAEVGALLLWATLSVPLTLGLYFGLRPVFRRIAARQAEK